MIGISLRGGLGNQMFQYAAARVAAERLGCPLAVHEWNVGRSAAMRGAGSRRVRAEVASYHPGVIQSRLGTGLQAIRETAGEHYYAKLHRRLFPRQFSPRSVAVEGEGEGEMEAYDPAFDALKPRTWLNGFFQSARYLRGHEAQVRRWFAPSPAIAAQVERLSAAFPKPAEQMVAIHVRRGDYLTQRGICAHTETGWALPVDYYRKALRELPDGLRIALFSDDPAFAIEHFGDLRPWVSTGNSAGVDLHLMASCRYAIIANSSLSWWGAFLNKAAAPVVVAPKYHLGFREKVWFPQDIDVDGWTYVEL